MSHEQAYEGGSAGQEGGPDDVNATTMINATPSQLDQLEAYRSAGIGSILVALPIVTKQVMRRVSDHRDKVWAHVAKSILSTLMDEQLVALAIDEMVKAAAASMSLAPAQVSIEPMLDAQGRALLYCSVHLASMQLTTTACGGFTVTDDKWPVPPVVGLATFKAHSSQVLVPAPIVNFYERSRSATRQKIERDDKGEIREIVTTPA